MSGSGRKNYRKKGHANAFIHGFDYSGQAISTAKAMHPDRAEFREGVIGEIEYPENSFDVITSMDTMYFAKDMTAFVSQIKKWLNLMRNLQRKWQDMFLW